MGPIDCLEHLTTQGERWDTLAWRYYGDPHDYGRIIEANPVLNINPTLPSGVVVLIPVMKLAEVQQNQQLTMEELPPWKQ